MHLILKGLPRGEPALIAYTQAWRNLLTGSGTKSQREVQRSLFGHFYDNLSILDNKTNSLLQLNGILLAAYVFVLTILHEPTAQAEMTADARDLFILGTAYAGGAILLCLSILRVYWSSTDELDSAEKHVRRLIVERNRRTVAYRRAWTFSFGALLCLLGVAVLLLEWWVVPAERPLRPLLVGAVALHLFFVFIYDHVSIGQQAAPATTAAQPARVATRPRSRPRRAASRPVVAPLDERQGS